VRYDVLHNNIPGLVNEKTKNEILGLCVTDMYREIIEDGNREYRDDDEKSRKLKIKYLSENYKSYIPKSLCEKHWIFLPKTIKDKLSSIVKTKTHDPL
jgi:hypothetical protein